MLRRYLHWFTLAIIPLLVLFLDNAIVHADADFESVRVRLTKDHSGKRGDPKDKYFRTSMLDPVPACDILIPGPDESVYVSKSQIHELRLTLESPAFIPTMMAGMETIHVCCQDRH